MLSEGEKEELRTLLVEHVLDVRAAYLQTAGANALRHWDMIQARVRASAKTASSVEEWATDLARSLRLDSPSPARAQHLVTLASFVRERRAAAEFLQLIDDEWGFVLAMARGIAEQRKEKSRV
jgi:hypothetical protein